MKTAYLRYAIQRCCKRSKVGLRWLLRFRKLDMSLKDQRQALVDTFINAIYLYDDKVLITFNYKEGTQTVTFGEAAEAASKGNGSDLDCFTAPQKRQLLIAVFFVVQECNPNPNHFPRMQLLSLLQRSRSVFLLYS